MGSTIIKIIILGLIGFIIFCIVAIVRMHKNAIDMSRRADVRKYIVDEQKRIDREKRRLLVQQEEIDRVKAGQRKEREELGLMDEDEDEDEDIQEPKAEEIDL